MKRFLMLTLALLMAMSGTARAERLNAKVLDLLTVDAQLPANLPEALPVLGVVPRAFDPDIAQALLMPDCDQREESNDELGRDVRFGTFAEGEAHMLVYRDGGYLVYQSGFWGTRLRDVISIKMR